MEFRINDERDKFFSILVPTRVFACSLAFFFSILHGNLQKSVTHAIGPLGPIIPEITREI